MLLRSRIFFTATGTLLLLVACQKPRPAPPLLAPDTKIDVGHFIGTPLSGPASTMPGAPPLAIDPHKCLALKISWLVLSGLPKAAMKPLGAQARLIVAERARQPVLPTTRLTLAARLGTPDELAHANIQNAPLANLTAVLPPGITLSCRLADPTPVTDPDTGLPTQRYVEVEAYRPGAGKKIALALTLQDLVIPAASADDFVVTGAAEKSRRQSAQLREVQRETALLDPASFDKPVALVIPFPLANTSTRAVAVIIVVDPSPPAAQLAKDIAAAKTDIARASVNAEPIPVVSSAWSAITAAVSSLGQPDLRRPALVFLASRTHAPILADLALVADPVVLAELVDRIQKQSRGASNPDALGWTLDHVAFDLLCDMQAKPHFPPELEAVLAAHAGEAARHASSLDEIRGGLTTRADFNDRVISENQIFLEDSSPASRIRAYDWLLPRGAAPPGYDPLGNPKARRAALDKFAQSPATAPATLPSGGAK